MHEMSIAMAVVAQVEEAAGAGGAHAVTSVRLQVGELAGVVPDALAFCFELACAGTALEGAELVTEPVPARARCRSCTGDWAVGMPPQLVCPGCGKATDVELLAGRELQILSVHWEDGPGPGCDRVRTPAPTPTPAREPISEER
ncbi:hydrogenase maturation nickel metallochaperone HypA [Streptomyces vinaceus]|uniref:Hydrogenase maturation factor HypA n=1 Tax=Streptomyces vinaceus TaxID=1960 RepID=A0A5J6IZM1_STRVI|nr:hydrogenase maturation nickel metallochaperone HypA [Streptomyces vinaceus]QEV44070.1 hydrogenase maturation nickel metallochaperone HypA [Streptomyces vinaceus]GHE72105.1 hydrogenase nickel incorporation protein HypA [Streptomyces vinaceus]